MSEVNYDLGHVKATNTYRLMKKIPSLCDMSGCWHLSGEIGGRKEEEMVRHESDLRCSQRSLPRRNWNFNAKGVSHILPILVSLFDRLIYKCILPRIIWSEMKVKDALYE
jgi:hypothetical protein